MESVEKAPLKSDKYLLNHETYLEEGLDDFCRKSTFSMLINLLDWLKNCYTEKVVFSIHGMANSQNILFWADIVCLCYRHSFILFVLLFLYS
jgi:hypothetical protein